MKIAVLTRNFSSLFGGAERYSVSLANELSKRHEIHVYCQETNYPIKDITYHTVLRIPHRLRWLNQLLFSLITWFHTRNNFDIVHSHEHVWHGDVHTMHVRSVRTSIFKNYQGFKKVLCWLNVLTSPRHLTYLWLESTRMRKYGLVFVSNQLSIEFSSRYTNIARHHSVIPPGVFFPLALRKREECRHQLNLSNDQIFLLFVANDFERKGLHTLLVAMGKLQPSIMLGVVGHSNKLPIFEKQVHKLGLTNRVKFYGQQEDLSVFYRAADLLVHPTLEDSFGLVVLEAMVQKLPVLVSSSPYCGFIQNLKDEIHVKTIQDPRDSDQLYKLIHRVLNDLPLRNTLVENGSKIALSFSWEEAALRYENVFRQIAKTSAT
jgi:UDP-glucose:(heptosyl)LPS alpha-1,3-glucosyltransferase